MTHENGLGVGAPRPDVPPAEGKNTASVQRQHLDEPMSLAEVLDETFGPMVTGEALDDAMADWEAGR